MNDFCLSPCESSIWRFQVALSSHCWHELEYFYLFTSSPVSCRGSKNLRLRFSFIFEMWLSTEFFLRHPFAIAFTSPSSWFAFFLCGSDFTNEKKIQCFFMSANSVARWQPFYLQLIPFCVPSFWLPISLFLSFIRDLFIPFAIRSAENIVQQAKVENCRWQSTHRHQHMNNP